MIALPHTADEFYSARDNRTNMYFGIAPQYTTARALVTADDGYLSTLAGQVCLLVSVNLLSRWCRHVQVEVDDVRRLDALGGSISWQKRLRRRAMPTLTARSVSTVTASVTCICTSATLRPRVPPST